MNPHPRHHFKVTTLLKYLSATLFISDLAAAPIGKQTKGYRRTRASTGAWSLQEPSNKRYTYLDHTRLDTGDWTTR